MIDQNWEMWIKIVWIMSLIGEIYKHMVFFDIKDKWPLFIR